MPYKNKEEQKEYRQNYRLLRKEGYSLRNTFEPRKCPICGNSFKPISKIHKFDSDSCRQKHWQRSQN